MTLRFLLLLLLLATLSLSARAGEFTVVPGTIFSYSDPAGLCRIDAQASVGEAAVVQMFEASDGGQLASLALFYDCPFVEWVRAGSTTDPPDPAVWIRIAAVKDGEGGLVSLPASRAEFLEEGAVELERMLGGMASEDLKAKLEEALSRLNDSLQQLDPASEQFQLSNVESLGVLAKEPEAVYGGVLTSVAQGGEQEVVLSLFGVTLLQSRIVYVYVFRPYQGTEQVAAQLAEARGLMQDLIARNDPTGEAGTGGSGFDWARIAMFAAIGAGAGLIVALLLKARKRRRAG